MRPGQYRGGVDRNAVESQLGAITDIAAVSEIAHAAGAMVVADGTLGHSRCFASP